MVHMVGHECYSKDKCVIFLILMPSYFYAVLCKYTERYFWNILYKFGIFNIDSMNVYFSG